MASDGAGAVLSFEGIVRPKEGDRPISALIYEDYEPMTKRELQNLAERIATDHGLLAIRVEHSRRRVPAGSCSFRLQVAAAHRAEAIASIDEFINTMKQQVPIWKMPVWLDDEQAFGEEPDMTKLSGAYSERVQP